MLRFSTSPTSDMHIGDLQVAIINYMVAQKLNEQFMVRIEDIDKEKNIEGKDEEILLILEKFALTSSHRLNQSDNLHIHQSLAIKLLQEKKAYICTCSTEEDIADCKCINSNIDIDVLKKDKLPFVIRVNESTNNNSFIILDKNGLTAPIFASVCDDMLSGVNCIIENAKDRKKERYIKDILNYKSPTQYIDIPVIENNVTIQSLFEKGFIPDAILNYLILLVLDRYDNAIFTLPEVLELEWFKFYKIPRSPFWFNLDSLKIINSEHLKLMEDKKLSSLFGFSDIDIGKLAKVYLDEVSTINELDIKIKTIFSPKDFNSEYGNEMRILAKIIADAPMINDFNDFKEYIIKESGFDDDRLQKPLKYLLTGEDSNIELSKIYPLVKSYILEVAS